MVDIKPPKKHIIDYKITVLSMPCGAVVESFSPGYPAKLNALPEDCYEGAEDEMEFIIVDRKGYRADWLMDKMTDDDWDDAREQIFKGMEE